MLLKELLLDIPHASLATGKYQYDIKSLAIDSRYVQPQSMFIAVSGVHHDGHDYIDQAINNGAKIIVIQSSRDIISCGFNECVEIGGC